MRNNKLLRGLTLLLLLFCLFIELSTSQSYSLAEVDARIERELRESASRYNRELRGLDVNGAVIRGCYASGKTLIMQYDVSSRWYPNPNGKSDIIAMSRESGVAESHFRDGISNEYQYYRDGRLLHTIHIDSWEYGVFKLGEVLSIKGHRKSMGVNMQVRVPVGWEVEEGDRPHVVKKFSYGMNTFSITITEGAGRVTREESAAYFSDRDVVHAFANRISSSYGGELLSHRVITIDRYPALEVTFTMNVERAGIELSNLHFRSWTILYGSKVITLGAGSTASDFPHIEPLFTKILTSIVFPDQYTH
jgi:hypothetical protein